MLDKTLYTAVLAVVASSTLVSAAPVDETWYQARDSPVAALFQKRYTPSPSDASRSNNKHEFGIPKADVDGYLQILHPTIPLAAVSLPQPPHYLLRGPPNSLPLPYLALALHNLTTGIQLTPMEKVEQTLRYVVLHMPVQHPTTYTMPLMGS
jgi:hypothetical protein